MRKLSTTFLRCLKSGFLSEITRRVQCDPDLNLEIRNGYINVYYKGNSLLKLSKGFAKHPAEGPPLGDEVNPAKE